MDAKAIGWFLLVAFLVVGVISGGQWYLLQKLQGEWRAVFEQDPKDENIEKVEAIKLHFFPDGSLVYEVVTKRDINSMHISENSKSTSTGFTQSTKNLNGTYKMKGWRVLATFPTRVSSDMRFDPFIIEDFGTDEETGKSYVNLSLKVKFEYDRLVVQGYTQGQEIALDKTQDGFYNSFSYYFTDNPYVASLRPRGREVLSRKTFVDGKWVEETPPKNFEVDRRARFKSARGIIGEQGSNALRSTTYQQRETPEYIPYEGDLPERNDLQQEEDLEYWGSDRYDPYDETQEPVDPLQMESAPVGFQEQGPMQQPVQYPIDPFDQESQDPSSPANLALMKATLRTLSTASETYATTHQGNYPSMIQDLTGAAVPYLTQPYCGEIISGYIYDCQFTPSGYDITAASLDGKRVYAIKTGGILTQRK